MWPTMTRSRSRDPWRHDQMSAKPSRCPKSTTWLEFKKKKWFKNNKM
jgi:hypothetical protein